MVRYKCFGSRQTNPDLICSVDRFATSTAMNMFCTRFAELKTIEGYLLLATFALLRHVANDGTGVSSSGTGDDRVGRTGLYAVAVWS